MSLPTRQRKIPSHAQAHTRMRIRIYIRIGITLIRWPTSAIQKFKYSSTERIDINTKIFISVQKYLFQLKNTCFSTKKIYFNPKIFISVPKYIFQSKNIYFSTKKSVPKSINISQVSLRPAGRREVSLSK